MARLTVEDCLRHVNNRFELVLKAAKRARKIMMGGEPVVAWKNDKPTVVALREIASGHLNIVDEPAVDEAAAVTEAFKEEMKEIDAAESKESQASGLDEAPVSSMPSHETTSTPKPEAAPAEKPAAPQAVKPLHDNPFSRAVAGMANESIQPSKSENKKPEDKAE